MKTENIARALEAVRQAKSGTTLCDLEGKYTTKHFYVLRSEDLETLWLRTDPQGVEWIQKKRGGKINLNFTAKIEWQYYDVRLEGLAEFFSDEDDSSQVKVKFTVNVEESSIRISFMILDAPTRYMVDDQPVSRTTCKTPWKCSCGAADNLGKYCMECAALNSAPVGAAVFP